MKCRHCKEELVHDFLDLGFAPPSNAYITHDDNNKSEIYFPLRLKVCSTCWLVQTEDYSSASELFTSDYAYFSSTSSSWLRHACNYVDKMISELGLNTSSFVVELASNDGYLLKNFIQKSIPCLGIEPTDSTAIAAEAIGVPTLREFFGEKLAEQLVSEQKQADLIAGNNVYAHVPDINDFTKGIKKLLRPEGTVTLEFPHLLKLISLNQFDTVYHEHYSYLSLSTVRKIFASAGLRVYKVDEIDTHGGSLRIYGCHEESTREVDSSVDKILNDEKLAGMQNIDIYLGFQQKADKTKYDFLSFLIEQKKLGKKVIGYGAAAKGNTLMNYAGIKPDMIPFVCDLAKSKQNKFLPGSHIPVVTPEEGFAYKPDYIVIFPWNIKEEVMSDWKMIHQWGGHFVVAVPFLQII
jgi:hypothetical protein